MAKTKVTHLPSGPEDTHFQEYQFDERLSAAPKGLDSSARTGYNNTWTWHIAERLANATEAMKKMDSDELYKLVESLQ